MRWEGHVACTGAGRDFGGKARRKETTRKIRRRWKGGIKMDLRENGSESVEWIQLAQDRARWRAVVNRMMNLQILAPQN
jgi:hypothetical protein